ncbi:hypothetical protein [Prochlorococcus sp. MIT 1341]|uniref:hypothetical protein n=1 Tax=Prochlorococcus sp. MIT 1341 TaxID=3096221 RepID=UPI002A75D07A|nr:hypothetical protein [Prochlorococcus sp. MIT 1341]
MSYEPGSTECRLLIEAKENLLNAMKAIKNLENMDSVQKKLMAVYNELEGMHELRRKKENSTLSVDS